MRILEPFNGASHRVGLLLAGVGTVLVLRLAKGPLEVIGFGIYGATLLLLFAASTIYHALPLPAPQLRALRTLDHISIYFLIAGTDTPVALITLNGRLGWTLLVAVWLIALAGIPFKLFFLDAPVWLSTGTYLAMGYLAVVALVPLAHAVSYGGLAWLIAGGLA